MSLYAFGPRRETIGGRAAVNAIGLLVEVGLQDVQRLRLLSIQEVGTRAAIDGRTPVEACYASGSIGDQWNPYLAVRGDTDRCRGTSGRFVGDQTRGAKLGGGQRLAPPAARGV